MRRFHIWIIAAFAFAQIAAGPDKRKGNTLLQIAFGNASWYGWWHENRLMANGKRFHASVESAASLTLPLGTWVRITNLANGRSVVTQITDRGPYVRGRIIDVSHATAVGLGMVKAGVVRVKVEPVAGEGEHYESGPDR